MNIQELGPGHTATANATLRVYPPTSTVEWQEAADLILAYAHALNLSHCFQNFDQELQGLSRLYGPPGGAFLLAKEHTTAIGCIGLRRQAAEVAEIKRLYVIPAARGRGIGRRLMNDILHCATVQGYRQVLLDTLPSMVEAQTLYRTLGFNPVPAYLDNHVAGALPLGLHLP